MKKAILFFLLLASALHLAAEPDLSKEIRDSIFSVANAEVNDTLRSKFLRKAFQEYIGQPSAVEYLDSALVLCTRKQLHDEELWVLFDYCRHYQFRADYDNMEQYFLKLKDASYRYNDYVLYYTIWLSVLQARCEQGDTEYAIMQAKEMKTEAIRLKYESGVFVSYLALAQAYGFAQMNREAIDAYKQALEENPLANDYSLLLIHGNLATLYVKEKQYQQALSQLELQLKTLQQIAENTPISETLKSIFLRIEIAFSQVYMKMDDKENMVLHLKKAGKYYNDNTFFGSYIDYHALWGGYYRLTQEWEKCFHEYDLALAAFQSNDSFYKNGVLKMKAQALLEAGDYKAAAENYRTAALRSDSLNQDMLQRHKEAHQANYNIRNALLEKEILKKRYLLIQVGSAGVILISLLLAIINAAFVRRQLRRSEEETRQAFMIAEAADKMKERFLHNITYEIRIPLNTVVGFSDLLSSENDLTDKEIQEYSAAIKNNSARLLSLINNILDLSRLEAGMMRFNVQECDVVQLCREAKMMIEMQTPGAMELAFHTELEELPIQADSKWLLKLLTSLLAPPKEKTEICHKAEYTLSKAGQYLTIVVKGSPLYHCWEDEQEQRILHDINRLYVETFKGKYQILGEEAEKLVSITYPVS